MAETINIEEQIEELLAQFDFSKVARTMEFLNWTWADGFSYKVPKLARIIERATELLESAYESYQKNSEWGCVSSGGFEATYDGTGFGLAFTIEGADNFQSKP